MVGLEKEGQVQRERVQGKEQEQELEEGWLVEWWRNEFFCAVAEASSGQGCYEAL